MNVINLYEKSVVVQVLANRPSTDKFYLDNHTKLREKE